MICTYFKLCVLELSEKNAASTNFLISPKYFRILDRIGLNFYAIYLKFSQIVDNYMAYYL